MPAQPHQNVRSLKSCEVCRRRKTRCELPEAALNLAPSDTPLPEQFVCYRCRVLGLPCVLVASTRASHQTRRSTADQRAGNASIRDATGRRLPAPSAELVERSTAATFASSLNTPISLVLTESDLHLSRHTGEREQIDIALTAFEPDLPSLGQPGAPESPTTSTPGHNSLIFHGRPLELTNIMIRMSYRVTGSDMTAPLPASPPDFTVMDEHLRGKIWNGYQELSTFVAYLPPFTTTLEIPRVRSETADQALHDLTLYLASLAVRNDPEVNRLTQTLIARLPNLILRLILEHPQSLHAVQVFSLLSTFAPLAALPNQRVVPCSVAVARGYIVMANDLAAHCQLGTMVDKSSFSQPSSETWLWLSIVAADSMIHLEELVPCPPWDLETAAELATILANSPHTPVPARLAQLALCERLQRLKEVYNALNQMQSTLETNNDVLGKITSSLASSTRALDALDDKYDSLIDSSSEIVTQAWSVNRSVRRLYELGVVQRTAIRSLYAATYLTPDNANLRSVFLQSEQISSTALKERMDDALRRATNPMDVARFFMQDPSPPSITIAQEWISKRSDGLEEILVALAEIDTSVVHLAPWHAIIAIVLDTSNVIFETQAAHIVLSRAVKRLKRDLRTSQRLYLMRCAADKIATLEPNFPSRAEAAATSSDSDKCQTVAAMCSELIKAMVRTAESRIKSLQKEASTTITGDNNELSSQNGYLTKGRSVTTDSDSGPSTSVGPTADIFTWPTSFSTFVNQGVGQQADIDMWSTLAQTMNDQDPAFVPWVNSHLRPTQDLTGVANQPSTLPGPPLRGQLRGNEAVDHTFDWLFEGT